MHYVFKSIAADANPKPPGVLALALSSALAMGCSAEAPCEPPIPAGARYQVTLGADTMDSSQCHIVDTTRIRTFEIKASKVVPTVEQPTCSVTPAEAPPPTQSITIEKCEPDSRDMLGVMCDIRYASTCPGQMRFFFDEAKGASVNWSAPQVDNIVFKVWDFRDEACLGGPGDCKDEYSARLVRLP